MVFSLCNSTLWVSECKTSTPHVVSHSTNGKLSVDNGGEPGDTDAEANGAKGEKDGGDSGNLRFRVGIVDAVYARKSGKAHSEGEEAGDRGKDGEDSSGDPVAGNADEKVVEIVAISVS